MNNKWDKKTQEIVNDTHKMFPLGIGPRQQLKQKISEALKQAEEELKDYKIRCQSWADQSLARDKYVQELEKLLDIKPYYIKEPLRKNY